MENTVKQRLIKYLDFKKVNKSEFARRINVSNAFVSSIRKSIQPDKIKRIALNFSDLNINWLLTGEGEMLKDTSIGGDSIIQTGEGHNAVINKNKYSGKFAGIPEGSQLQYLMEQNRQLLQQNQKFQDHIDRLLGIIEDMSKK